MTDPGEVPLSSAADAAAIGPGEARIIIDFGVGPAGVGPAYSIDSGDFLPSTTSEASPAGDRAPSGSGSRQNDSPS